MSDSERKELIALLGELSALCPDMRIGQLIANLAVVARGAEPGAIWDMEDDELLGAIQRQLAVFRGRQSQVA